MADLWKIDLGDEQAGHVLAESVRTVADRAVALLDPSALLDYIRGLPPSSMEVGSRRDVALAALLATQGRSPELEELLTKLGRDREWLDFNARFIRFVRDWIAPPVP